MRWRRTAPYSWIHTCPGELVCPVCSRPPFGTAVRAHVLHPSLPLIWSVYIVPWLCIFVAPSLVFPCAHACVCARVNVVCVVGGRCAPCAEDQSRFIHAGRRIVTLKELKHKGSQPLLARIDVREHPEVARR